MSVECPHCQNQTVLSSPEQPEIYGSEYPESWLQALPPKPLPGMEPSTAEVDYEEQEFHTGEESTNTTEWWAILIGAGVFAAVHIGYLTYNAFWGVKNFETYMWMSEQFVCAVGSLGFAFTEVAQRKMLPIGFLIAGLSITIGGIVGFNSISAQSRDLIRNSEQGESLDAIKKKAEQGDADAQNDLGVKYANGEGVTKDEAEAVNWVRKSAEQGNAQAQFMLGGMYYKGQGVAKDEVEAVNWWRKSAKQGNAQAQFNLGIMYGNGEGVAKDETAGYMWCLLAGGQGNETARKNVRIIEKSLTSEQRAEGQRMAKDWKPKKAQGK
jgi:hypothetical protein